MCFFLMVHNSSDGFAFQVKLLEGPSEEIIPQLKKKYEVDTLDFVFLDHWKDRYAPDTILLQVSLHNSSLNSKIANTLMSVRTIWRTSSSVKWRMAAKIATLQEQRIWGTGSQTFVKDNCWYYIAQDLANTVEPFCFLNKWVCCRNPSLEKCMVWVLHSLEGVSAWSLTRRLDPKPLWSWEQVWFRTFISQLHLSSFLSTPFFAWVCGANRAFRWNTILVAQLGIIFCESLCHLINWLQSNPLECRVPQSGTC